MGVYQFPGGYLEYGESFEECSARELLEEAGVTVSSDIFKYVTTLNVRRTDIGYHNVGIIMSVKLDKSIEIKNLEPDKNKEWVWMKWDKFIQLDNLFYPVILLKELGFTDLNQYK